MARKIKEMSKQITKSYLEYLGITEVTSDGRVFTKNGERKPYLVGRSKSKNQAANQDRLAIRLHDSEKYKATSKEKLNSSSGLVSIKVHQVVYAWFHGEVPYGKEIHHRDCDYLNNNIDNLVALTKAEHAQEHRKMRELMQQEAVVEEKCRLDIPREHYVKKIDEYMKKKAWANASQYKRRLKYYDNHIEEANKLTEFKKYLMELKAWKEVFRENNNKVMWKECIKVEKVAKEKSPDDAALIVKHALDVLHNTFGRKIDNEAI